MAGVQVFHQVRGADDDGPQAGMAARDGVQAQKAQWSLGHGPQRQVRGGARRVQRLGQRGQLRGRLHLGQQHGVGAGAGNGAHVFQAPVRVQRVDAYDAFAASVAAFAQCGGDLLAGLALGVGRHRVFQVQDQGVRVQGARLVQCAGIGAGHVENGAAGADGGVHACGFSVWEDCR
ncbi:hypothetical protein D3C87_1625320 [compost metagenome]